MRRTRSWSWRLPHPALVLLLAGAAAPARADSAAPAARNKGAVDVSAIRDKLVLLGDGHRHYVAATPYSMENDQFFYGDGKTFYSLPIGGGGSEAGKKWEVYFVEPRVRATADATIQFQDGKYTVKCGARTTVLSPVEAKEAGGLLAAAAFEHSPRKWRAHALARDNNGLYYFVDQGRTPDTEKSYRLFVGPKGALKQQKMTNVVSDSEGEIFATRTGSLRLILNKNESSWVQHDKPKKLLLVPVEDNVTMIYNELGPYTGERLGTPCDDL